MNHRAILEKNHSFPVAGCHLQGGRCPGKAVELDDIDQVDAVDRPLKSFVFLENLFNNRPYHLDVEGLLDKAQTAAHHRFVFVGVRRIGGHDDYAGAGETIVYFHQEIQPVHARHVDIGYDQIHRSIAENSKSFFSRFCREYFDILHSFVKISLQHPEHIFFIIDNQYFLHNLTNFFVPFPGRVWGGKLHSSFGYPDNGGRAAGMNARERPFG